MGRVTSEDGSENRYGSYSLIADGSEAGILSYDAEEKDGPTSRSVVYSPFAPGGLAAVTPTFSFPVIGGKDVVVWDDKLLKRGADLSATVFGELWRLEQLAPQKKAMWCREMECLLSVSDSIMELVPLVQQFPGGDTYDILETRSRSDLHMNLIALKKLDAMLISILGGFRDTEFGYVDRGIVVDDYDNYAS